MKNLNSQNNSYYNCCNSFLVILDSRNATSFYNNPLMSSVDFQLEDSIRLLKMLFQ